MTTGTNPEVSAAARRWAAGLLGVQENASAADARRAYFRKVRESDFLPPGSLHRALRVFDDKLAPDGPDEEWLLEEEGRLRAEVESFAEEFFTLPVIQRHERWDTLLSRCQSAPSLTARLQALKKGLEVETKNLPLDQSFHGELVQHLIRSFPLPPLAQAVSRQAFLRQIEEYSAAVHRKSWEKAARYCLAECPALVALDEELVKHVAKLRSRLERQSELHPRTQLNRNAAPAVNVGGTPWWFLVIPAVVFGIMRGAATFSNSSASGPSPPSSSTSPISSFFPGGLNLVHTNSHGDSRVTQYPLIQDLLDPSKYDVEALGENGGRILHFTPRPGSTITGPNGQEPNSDQPIWLGEASLRLMGFSSEGVDALFRVAAARKPVGNTPKTTPDEVGRMPPKSSQRDKTRP